MDNWFQSTFGNQKLDSTGKAMVGADGQALYEGAWGNFADGLQGLGSLFNAYMGYRNLKLGRDSLNFNKQLAQTNLANSATAHNAGLESRYNTYRSNLSSTDRDTAQTFEQWSADKRVRGSL